MLEKTITNYLIPQQILLSGSISNGVHAFLGRYHVQVSVLLEGREKEMFGWIAPGSDKFSVTRTFLSHLAPSRLFKMACDICISKDLLIDPILIQAVIILIQCEKIFSKFNLIGTDKDELTSRVLFRSKYLDLIALYDTYDIFREFNDYLKEILNEKQMKLGDIFDSVEMPESIKNLALLK